MHFTGIFGAMGLLVFVMAVFFLLQQKGAVIHVAIQATVLLLVITSYAYTILRDLRQDESEIEKLLSRVLDEKDDSDDEPLMP